MKHILVFAFLLFANMVFAQKIISGRVVDHHNKSISGATVSVLETNIFTKTDATGKYTITVPRDYLILKVEKVNFITKEVGIIDDIVNVVLTPYITEDTTIRKKTLTGQIVNTYNNPIPEATVYVIDTDVKTQTDSNGMFRVEVPELFMVLKVMKPDYKSTEITIDSSYLHIHLISLVDYNAGKEVVSATKTSLVPQKAPSVIRIFTSADFSEKGLYTLGDILATIPGIQMSEYRMGHQLAWVRGVQSRYNNKVLLLIDGMPMRDGMYGNFQTNEMLPLDAVEKIEVINGPASVLYGANGLAGVINVTTKSKGKSVGTRVGSNNALYGVAEYDYKGLYANVSATRTDGFSPALNYDGKALAHPQDESGQNVLLKYQNKSLMLSGTYTNYSTPYRYNKSNQDATLRHNPMYFIGRYNLDLKRKGKLALSTYFNYYPVSFEKIFYKSYTDFTIKNKLADYHNSYLFGSELDYQISLKKHIFLAGLTFMNDKALNIREIYTFENFQPANREQPYITEPNVSHATTGLYLQDVWNLNKNVMLTGGIRYDILSHFNNQFDYRIGITGQSDNNYYGKLLIGTAYRVPSPREYLYVYTTNPNLQPEHLQTFEAQVGRIFTKSEVNLTFFNNSYTNFITELLVDSIKEDHNVQVISGAGGVRVVGDEYSQNFKSRMISGLELNASSHRIKNLYLNVGVSYIIKAKSELGDLDPAIFYNSSVTKNTDAAGSIYCLAKYTGNFMVSYKFFNRVVVGLNGLVFGKRNVPENYESSAPIEVRDISNADGFVKMDAFASADLFTHLNIKIKVSNLANAKIYSPSIVDYTMYDAQWQGRTYRLAMSWKF